MGYYYQRKAIGASKSETAWKVCGQAEIFVYIEAFKMVRTIIVKEFDNRQLHQ